MTSSRFHGTVAGLALTAAAAAVNAQMSDGVEELVVRGRWDNPIGYSVTASHGVVGAEELDLRPRLRTGEILEVVPGMIVTQHSGTGKSHQMFLRGFNLDHGTDFATYVDGMPVNMPTHGHGQGYTDVNFLIPELVERLEYRKGGYYAEVGDFSAAGSARLSTFRKLDEGLVKIGLGENGYQRALIADSVGAGGGDFLFGLQTHRYDGPWTDVSEDLERHNALLRYSSGGERSAWNVALMGYDAKWASADQVPRRAVEQGLIDRLGSIDTDLGGESSRYSLSGGWSGDLAGGVATIDAYVIDYDLDLYSNFTYWLDDPADGDEFRQIDERTVSGANFALVLGGEARSTHTFGATFRYDDIDDVGLFRTAGRALVETIRRDTVEQHSLGLYYSNETAWSERFRTILGLRGDWYDFDVVSDLAANSGNASDSLISPKVDLIYSPSERLELYLAAGRAFHSNDARGTTITIDPGSGEPAERVNPLVPADGAEIGFRAFVDRRLNVSASLWVLELDSELLFVGDAGATEASLPSRRYGIEVPLYYRPTERLTFDFEVALTRSEFRGGDPGANEIPGSIDRVLAAGVSAELGRGFYGSLRARHFGPRPLTEDGGVESESSTLLNLAVGLERPRFDLRLEVLNLLDADDDDITYFYPSRLPGEPADGVEDIHAHPIEPRTARLYWRWRL